FAEADRLAREAAAMDSVRGDVEQVLLPPLVEAERSLFIRYDADRARRELDAALAARPFAAYPARSRPYLYAARLFAFAGEAERARELIAQHEREMPVDMGAIASMERRWIDVFLALGTGDPATALNRVRNLAPDETCAPCIEFASAMTF